MRLLVCCLVSLAIFLMADAKPTKETKYKAGEKATCGYDACHPITEGVTNVHLVAHTHDDVGWLKTLDQYYYGSNTNIQRAGVQYILDSVIKALLKDPTRKFIYVESAFFFRWWQEQGDQMRADVHLLVAEGRLEFTGGAWSMNDEAATHYQSIVDQFTWGLRKLNDTFGSCGKPRAGWQIDPFGHSREMANLYKAMGYDGMLLNRIDFQDKQVRVNNKQMEMTWRGSDDLGASSDLFNGVLYNHYSPPSGFCFDILCNDDPFIDDVDSPDYNVESKVNDFVQFIEQQQNAYATNNVIVTMGNDFNYQDAHVWFKNLDKLIKYVNAKESKMTLFYSTPSCYIKAVQDANVTLPTKEDDFFPYASDDHSYWTGYFSSRPTLKYFERKGNNILQACKQLNAVTNSTENDGLEALRSALGVMQHHDAVTGTEKQHVANDYARILDQAIQNCMISTREALNKLMSSASTEKQRDMPEMSRDAPNLSLTLCNLNITECSVSEQSKNFVVTVYNPLGHAINHPVRIPITGGEYLVRDTDGKEIPTQTVKISPNSQRQLIRHSNATEELIFLVESLPALGYRSFYISQKAGNQKQLEPQEEMMADQSMPVERTEQVDEKDFSKKKAIDEENSIGNDKLTLSVDPETGFVKELYIADKDLTIALKQELLYYEAALGNNEVPEKRSSGAYIFRPKFTTAESITTKPENTFSKGALVEEINQRFSDWASQTIRIYKNSSHVEFEWIVGPIPVEDGIGKEVISRFSTDIETNGTFYTDSNGRQLLKRVLNQRPMWDVMIEEPVAGNYYPVTSVIAIHDAKNDLDLSVLTDRAQGGSSLKNGEVELMVHRRLLHDDDFGVGEALNEVDGGKGLVAKGTHYLQVGGIQDKGLVYRRQLILVKHLEPITLFSSADDFTYAQWTEARNEFSGLKTELPANVHLLTAEPWKENTLLIRLEHFLQKTDDPADLSKPVTVNIAGIFADFEVLAVRETKLAGNVFLEQDDRMTRDEVTQNEDNSVPQMDETKYLNSGTKETGKLESFEITLEPMQIRTFIVTVKF